MSHRRQEKGFPSEWTELHPGWPGARLWSFASEHPKPLTMQGTPLAPKGWDGLAGRRPTAQLVEEIMMLRAVYQPSLNGRPGMPN